MADAKLTALTAASALAAADLFYVSQSAASRKATGTQLLTLVGTTYVPLAGNATMTGALTIASGTLTASAPALSITQTWNQGATSFIGIRLNITNTDSAASYPLVVTVNSSDVFFVSKSGDVTASYFKGSLDVGGQGDLLLVRDAAATLAQRNSTTQQKFRLYNTYTDASNYERLTLTGVAGTSVNITAETLGTGGDNLDIVLTPAGTGKVRLPDGLATQLALCFTTTTNTGIFAAVSGTRFGIVSNGTFSLNVASNFISMPTASVLGWTSVGGADGSSIAAGLAYNAAGVVEVNSGTAGTWRDLKLRNLLQTEYHQMTEMTAPSAPATNSVRIYAEDNGSGKTRLMALFATGAAQQIAIEP